MNQYKFNDLYIQVNSAEEGDWMEYLNIKTEDDLWPCPRSLYVFLGTPGSA